MEASPKSQNDRSAAQLPGSLASCFPGFLMQLFTQLNAARTMREPIAGSDARGRIAQSKMLTQSRKTENAAENKGHPISSLHLNIRIKLCALLVALQREIRCNSMNFFCAFLFCAFASLREIALLALVALLLRVSHFGPCTVRIGPPARGYLAE